MIPNLVYASGSRRTMPYDLQRHITTKFLNKKERRQYSIDLLYTDFLQNNLKALPKTVLVKLFVNGIYNKCSRELLNSGASWFQIGSQGRRDHISSITTLGPIQQYLKCWLDTIYYGFSTSEPISHTGDASNRPAYAMSMRAPTSTCFSSTMQYVPTKGHSELTTNIHITDLVRFIHMFIHLGERAMVGPHSLVDVNIARPKLNKLWIGLRNDILYDFSVILKYLGDKYRNIKKLSIVDAQLLKDRQIVQKEEAILAKKLAKEEAVRVNQLAKEEAIVAKKLAKEEAIVAKKLAKEETVRVKKLAKEEAIVAKKLAKEEDIVAKKLAKEEAFRVKKLAKEEAFRVKKLAKEDAIVAKKLAKEEIIQMKREDKMSKKMT